MYPINRSNSLKDIFIWKTFFEITLIGLHLEKKFSWGELSTRHHNFGLTILSYWKMSSEK